MGPLLRRSVPYVPQMQLAECGAACLSMVLGYHGHHLALAEAREECSVSRDGASAHSIAKAAEARGLAVRALRVEDPEGLAAVRLPAIVHLRDRHFVVLERVQREHALVVDPAQGRRKATLAELCASSSGVVLTFEPTARLTRRRRPQASRAIYVGAVRHHARATAMVVASSLTLELLAVVFPSASQVLVDCVIRPKQESWLWILAGVLLVATALRLALLALRDRVMHALNQLLDLRFMTSFVDRLLRLPLSFFHHRTTGDLMDRVAANLELRGLSTRIVRTCMDALVVIPYGALMLAYDVKLGLVVLGLTAVRIAAVTALQRRGKEAALLEQTRRGRESSALVQTFGSAELTKLRGVRDFLRERYTERLASRLEATLDRRKLTEGIGQLTIAIEGVMQGLVLLVAGRELFADRITVGVFAAFLTIGALIQRPLESLVGTLMQLGRLRSLLARTDDVFETPAEESGAKDPGIMKGQIALRHVSFRYGEQSPDVVDDVSFEVKRGEKIAIVGPSGSGKSTLARLMVGLLTPRRGSVHLDGVDLRVLDLERVRRQMGIVTQETFLFDDTVANNLRLKDADLALDQLRAAAAHACIDEVIEALPRGYETLVGAHGHRLSGGQRQRLALARALAAEPSILLLDEATSSLDLPTEERVHQHLGAFACTRIVIAHRLATVRDADRILVLERGKIVQQGSYVELAARPGLFRSLLETMEQAA